jgi:hypothetical protein
MTDYKHLAEASEDSVLFLGFDGSIPPRSELTSVFKSLYSESLSRWAESSLNPHALSSASP